MKRDSVSRSALISLLFKLLTVRPIAKVASRFFDSYERTGFQNLTQECTLRFQTS